MMLITTLVVSLCKDIGAGFSVNLWFLVVYVRCEVLCRFVVATAYQLQQSDKELHTEHTPLRTINLH